MGTNKPAFWPASHALECNHAGRDGRYQLDDGLVATIGDELPPAAGDPE